MVQLFRIQWPWPLTGVQWMQESQSLAFNTPIFYYWNFEVLPNLQ
jgi:hypothetical protein